MRSTVESGRSTGYLPRAEEEPIRFPHGGEEIVFSNKLIKPAGYFGSMIQVDYHGFSKPTPGEVLTSLLYVANQGRVPQIPELSRLQRAVLSGIPFWLPGMNLVKDGRIYTAEDSDLSRYHVNSLLGGNEVDLPMAYEWLKHQASSHKKAAAEPIVFDSPQAFADDDYMRAEFGDDVAGTAVKAAYARGFKMVYETNVDYCKGDPRLEFPSIQVDRNNGWVTVSRNNSGNEKYSSFAKLSPYQIRNLHRSAS